MNPTMCASGGPDVSSASGKAWAWCHHSGWTCHPVMQGMAIGTIVRSNTSTVECPVGTSKPAWAISRLAAAAVARRSLWRGTLAGEKMSFPTYLGGGERRARLLMKY